MTGFHFRKTWVFVINSIILIILVAVIFLAKQRIQETQNLKNTVVRLEHNESVLLKRIENLEGYRRSLHRKNIFLDILGQTIEIRELPTYQVVPIKTVGEEFLLSFIEEELEEELGEKIHYIERVLKIMGLIVPEYQLRSEIINLYLEQTAGFYDYKRNSFYIMDSFEMNSTLGKIIVAHEITHFLQDQYFDLEQLINQNNVNTDREAAILSIIEGDATLAMIEWSMEYGIPGSIRELTDFLIVGEAQVDLGRSPLIIQDMLIQPYLVGLDFFLYLQNSGIEDWRNKPFHKPPLSMEMVLHPEKYLAYIDIPREMELPQSYIDTHGAVLYTDVFGELYLRSIIKQFNLYKDLHYTRIAKGWNGDAFFLFENDFLLWMIGFDTPADEDDFRKFFQSSEEYWQKVLEQSGTRLYLKEKDGIFFFEFSPIS